MVRDLQSKNQVISRLKRKNIINNISAKSNQKKKTFKIKKKFFLLLFIQVRPFNLFTFTHTIRIKKKAGNDTDMSARNKVRLLFTEIILRRSIYYTTFHN